MKKVEHSKDRLGAMKLAIKDIDSNSLLSKFMDLWANRVRGMGGSELGEQIAVGQEEILRRMIAGHEDNQAVNVKSKK